MALRHPTQLNVIVLKLLQNEVKETQGKVLTNWILERQHKKHISEAHERLGPLAELTTEAL